MTTDYDTRVSVSPQPPQDGRWAIFVPASYKNMALGEAQLSALPALHSRLAIATAAREVLPTQTAQSNGLEPWET
jgi:hypothetical protein